MSDRTRLRAQRRAFAEKRGYSLGFQAQTAKLAGQETRGYSWSWRSRC
jgi:hypothetical protein